MARFFTRKLFLVVSVRLRKLSILSELNISSKVCRAHGLYVSLKIIWFEVSVRLRKLLLISQLYINSKLWKTYGLYLSQKIICRVNQIHDITFFNFNYNWNSWQKSFFYFSLSLFNLCCISDSFSKYSYALIDWLVFHAVTA